MSLTLTWRNDPDDEGRWICYVNGIRTTGLDCTMNREGKYVVLGEVYDDIEGAKDWVETVLEIHDALGTDYMESLKPTTEQLAEAVISMARTGGMPDSFWLTDSRIAMACSTLGISAEEARDR